IAHAEAALGRHQDGPAPVPGDRCLGAVDRCLVLDRSGRRRRGENGHRRRRQEAAGRHCSAPFSTGSRPAQSLTPSTVLPLTTKVGVPLILYWAVSRWFPATRASSPF